MADLIPLSAVSAGPPLQGPRQDTAPPPDLIPLDQVAVTPPAIPKETPESTFQGNALGPASGPLNAFHGFTDQMGRALTFGLSDKAAAAAPAINAAIQQGADALKSGATADASVAPQMPQNRMVTLADIQAAPGPGYAPVTQNAPSAPPPSVSDAYHTALQGERSAGEQYAQNHPVASKVATTLGTVASVPLIAGQGAVAPTLGGRMLQGVKVGTGVGAAAGFGGSNDQSLQQTAIDTAEGAGIGGVTGAAAPVIAEHVVSPIYNWIARRFSPAAVDNQAVQRIVQRIGQDTEGGGPSAQDMLDLANAAAPNKPITLADLGGNNVLGEAGRVARAPGPGKQTAIDTLNARDAGAGTRLAGDVDAGISNGGSAFDTVQALQQARAAAARPAYEAAGIPSDPAQFSHAPLVDNPQVTRLLQKSKDVQSAIAQAKALPDYADLPDNSMVLLDKAYKNIGGSANAAKIAGNGEQARDLNSLRTQLLDAMTGGDGNHPYRAALQAFSGPSQTMDAVRLGQTFQQRGPEEIAAEFNKLTPGDQEFYKLGAADALKTQLARTGMAGDEAKRLIGNDQIQRQLRPLFSDQPSYDRFINAARTENRMFDTRNQTIGNAATAGRVAEDDGARGGGGLVSGAVEAGAGLLAGEHVAPLAGGLRILKALGSNRPPSDPGVNAAISRMLFSTDQGANRDVLARIIAGQNAPSMLPSATVPLASLAAQGAPPLLRGYQGRQR